MLLKIGYDSSGAAARIQQAGVECAGCSPALTPPWCPGLCSRVFAPLVTPGRMDLGDRHRALSCLSHPGFPLKQVSSSSSGMLGIFGEICGGKRGKSQRSCKRDISTPLSHPTGCLHSVTCLVPVRGWFVTLLKVKNHLLKDEKSAGLEVTRFWPKLLRLESCTEEADCFQPERV